MEAIHRAPHNEGLVDFYKKIYSPLSLVKAFQMNLISAGSISRWTLHLTTRSHKLHIRGQGDCIGVELQTMSLHWDAQN